MKKALQKFIRTLNTEEDGPQNREYIEKRMRLHYAVLTERESDVRKYAAKYVDKTDSLNRTPLHLAIAQGNENYVQILVESKADCTIADNEGYTPLLRAIETGNLKLVEIVLKAVSDRMQATHKGDTALHLSVSNGFPKITEKLLELGFPTDVPNKAGDCCLHVAVHKNLFTETEMILHHGGDPNVEDLQSRIPLQVAIEKGYTRVVEILLKSHSNIDHKDLSGKTAKDYALLLKDDHALSLMCSKKNSSSYRSNDDDSQTSEPIIIPPLLKAPLSWAALQMGQNEHDEYSQFRYPARFKDHDHNTEPSRSQPRSTKSWSFDFPAADAFKSGMQKNRCTSLTSNQLLNRNSILDEEIDPGALKNQLEDCQKALNKLSLEMLNKDGDRNAHELGEGSLGTKHKDHSFNKDGTESSDDDLPFWKKSLDGGKFVDTLKLENVGSKNIESSISESDTDSDEKSEVKEISNNTVLNRLKQVSQENEDLDTEAAVLREATEKLKYDLANYRQLANIKDTNLAGVTAQLEQLDKKYIKATEKIHAFQLCMSNLEQEIAHLTRICNKSYQANLDLVRQMKQIQDTNSQIKLEKDKVVDQNSTDIQKLQADVLYWKSKYEDLAKTEKGEKPSFEMQSLFNLNMELNKLGDQIKDCLSKNDLAKLQDQQQVFIGKTIHQLLDEAENKLQSSLIEIKKEMRSKVFIDSQFAEKSDVELRIMDFENTKQKLLLEVSKLSVSLKEKEAEEQKLREQLERFQKEKQKAKDEKRRFLIRKTFEQRSSIRKGMYFNAVKNYVNRSKHQSSADSTSEECEKESESREKTSLYQLQGESTSQPYG